MRECCSKAREERSKGFQGEARLSSERENSSGEMGRQQPPKEQNQQLAEQGENRHGNASRDPKCWWVEKKGPQANPGLQKLHKNTKLCFHAHYLVSLLMHFLFYLLVKHYKILLAENEKLSQYKTCTGLVKQGK